MKRLARSGWTTAHNGSGPNDPSPAARRWVATQRRALPSEQGQSSRSACNKRPVFHVARQRFAAAVAGGVSRNTRYQAGATPYLGRTFTCWIPPAWPGAPRTFALVTIPCGKSPRQPRSDRGSHRVVGTRRVDLRACRAAHGSAPASAPDSNCRGSRAARIRALPGRRGHRPHTHQDQEPTDQRHLRALPPHGAGRISRVAFRKKIYRTVDELQADLDAWVADYNANRPHQGRWCYGKTPMQTFLDSPPLAKEKLMAA